MPPIPASDEYLFRLKELAREESQRAKLDRALGIAKLASGLATVVLIVWLAKYHSTEIAFVFLPILGLVALFVWHERVLGAMRRCSRLRRFYEQGMARLEDRWAGTGQSGDQFLDSRHPYARDLDLFGSGSLFEFLCTARTRAGEETLAQWLRRRAPMEETQRRQGAVKELTPLLDFRERLALAGEEVRIGVQPDALIAWAESEERMQPYRLLRLLLPALGLCWIASIAIWLALDWGTGAALMSLLNLAITYRLRPRVDRALGGIDEASHELDLLASLLREIEDAQFRSARLTELQQNLRCDGVCPSASIRALNKRVTWLDAHENWFIKVLDLFIFWTPQWVMAVERWRARSGPHVRQWIAVAGEVEALTSLGSFAYENPQCVFPDFVEEGPYFHAEGLAHPLLPRARAVANDLQLDGKLQLIVISGPNMAGKSTFIRSVGINVVLAQAGAPVCASRLTLSSLEVAASICVLDSLQGGLSRFYAEITRLKAIDDLLSGDAHVLFLLDELLSGTNSHDRRIGTESFVSNLISHGAIGLVTTHDLALAEIANRLDGRAANFHFADRLENGELRFDYKLTPGVVQTANALKLMRSIGLNV